MGNSQLGGATLLALMPVPTGTQRAEPQVVPLCLGTLRHMHLRPVCPPRTQLFLGPMRSPGAARVGTPLRFPFRLHLFLYGYRTPVSPQKQSCCL